MKVKAVVLGTALREQIAQEGTVNSTTIALMVKRVAVLYVVNSTSRLIYCEYSGQCARLIEIALTQLSAREKCFGGVCSDTQ